MTKNACEGIFQFLAIAFISFGTGVFWAFLVSELIRHVFDLNEDKTLIYFGGPFLVIYFFWCWRLLSRIFSRAGGL
ncbi:hypothetical protein [Burkholderia stagnalis]|uniref:hypothetical protein n=1 Tax=Burkholderia stagnalis TaxID=1503054 RepID=UPI000AC8996A|nr:hypothetical protein [Burkholderia stagnalis]